MYTHIYIYIYIYQESTGQGIRSLFVGGDPIRSGEVHPLCLTIYNIISLSLSLYIYIYS